MDLTSIVGLGAVATVIYSSWGNIKSFFNQISAIFIGRVVFYDIILTNILYQELSKGKKLPDTITYINSIIMYNKTNQKKCVTAYKNAFGWDVSTSIFFYKKTLIFFTNNGYSNSIYYIRGFFNFEKFMSDALNFSDTQLANLNTEKRFSVTNVFGSIENNSIIFPSNKDNSSKDNTDKDKEEKNDVSTINRILSGLYPIIGRNFNELTMQNSCENYQYINHLSYPDDIMAYIAEAIEWKNSSDWYTRRGIPWTKGWLLYGKPGTGKSALTKAVAEVLDIPVFLFHLSTMSNKDFVDKWKETTINSPVMIVFEDLDGVFHKRENINKNTTHNVVTFDTFLGCLDGISKNDGVFTVITTNHIEKIDEALGSVDVNGMSTRPGRIDNIIELKQLDKKCMLEIANKILFDHSDEEKKKLVDESCEQTASQFTKTCINFALKNKKSV